MKKFLYRIRHNLIYALMWVIVFDIAFFAILSNFYPHGYIFFITFCACSIMIYFQFMLIIGSNKLWDHRYRSFFTGDANVKKKRHDTQVKEDFL